MNREGLMTELLSAPARPEEILEQALALGSGDPRTLADMIQAVPTQTDQLSDWDRTIDHIQNSEDTTRRNSIFLGRHLHSDRWVTFPCEALLEHFHLTGGSGQRKTSLVLTPIAIQLLRKLRRDLDEGGLGHSGLYFDLKGDPFSFHAQRLECERLGVRFLYLSLVPGHCSHIFNPVDQKHLDWMDVSDIAQTLFSGLGLEFGPGYGRAHFSLVQLQAFLLLLKKTFGARSYRDLAQNADLKSAKLIGIPPQTYHDVGDLFSLITILAEPEPLNCPPSNQDQVIDMSDVVTRPTWVYLFLPTFTKSTVARIVACQAVYLLVAAAMFHHVKPKRLRDKWPPLPVYCFADEFAQMATEQLAHLIAQARSFKIGMFMAHQAFQDLGKENVSLLEPVLVNTRGKIRMSARSVIERKMLQDASGIDEAYDLQERYDGDWALEGNSVSYKEVPRFHTNELIRALDDYRVGYFELSPAGGYEQTQGFPQLVRFEHFQSHQEYLRLLDSDWPRRTKDTILNPIHRRTEQAQAMLPETKPAPGPAPKKSQASKTRNRERRAKKNKQQGPTPTQQKLEEIAKKLNGNK